MYPYLGLHVTRKLGPRSEWGGSGTAHSERLGFWCQVPSGSKGTPVWTFFYRPNFVSGVLADRGIRLFKHCLLWVGAFACRSTVYPVSYQEVLTW